MRSNFGRLRNSRSKSFIRETGVKEYCKVQFDLSPRLCLLIHSFKGNPLELTPNKFVIKEVLKLTELRDKIEIMISFSSHFLLLFVCFSSH
jgi:hypothetical protein